MKLRFYTRVTGLLARLAVCNEVRDNERYAACYSFAIKLSNG